MQEFDEWLDSGIVLTFTEDGPEFRVEPPSALTVLRLRRRLVDDRPLNDGVEHDAIIEILGDTWDRMAAAGIPELVAVHAGRAVLTRYLDSADSAIKVWTFTPEEPTPEPEKPRGPSIYGVDPDDSVDPPGTINAYDPGGGPYMPDKGIRVWAYPMEFAPINQQQVEQDREHERASWSDIFAAWEAVEVDFAQIFHCDITPELLAARQWRWFAVRLTRVIGDPDSFSSRLISTRKADT